MFEIAFLWGSDRFIGKAIVSYFIPEINFGENSDAHQLGLWRFVRLVGSAHP